MYFLRLLVPEALSLLGARTTPQRPQRPRPDCFANAQHTHVNLVDLASTSLDLCVGRKRRHMLALDLHVTPEAALEGTEKCWGPRCRHEPAARNRAFANCSTVRASGRARRNLPRASVSFTHVLEGWATAGAQDNQPSLTSGFRKRVNAGFA